MGDASYAYRMSNIESHFGMNDVRNDWNWLSMAYEVSVDDNYRWHDTQERYSATVQFTEEMGPEGNPVASMDRASLTLPPCQTNARIEPEEPSPYLGMGDASYAYSYTESPFGTGSDNPAYAGWSPIIDVRQDMAPEKVDAWKLSPNDLESMFLDYFRNVEETCVAQLENSQRQMACSGGFAEASNMGTGMTCEMPSTVCL